MADLEQFSSGTLWLPLAGGIRPSRIMRRQALLQSGRRPFLLGTLSASFLYPTAMEWSEQAESFNLIFFEFVNLIYALIQQEHKIYLNTQCMLTGAAEMYAQSRRAGPLGI